MAPNYGNPNQRVGTIFSVPTTGGSLTVLFAFDYTHGALPYGSLIISGSTLYGMTAYGGDYGQGTIFSISTSGGTPTILHSFDGADGARPEGSLTLSPDGLTLYGMAQAGINQGDNSPIFSIPTSGGSLTVLFGFDGGDVNIHGSLTLSPDGLTLYGMTYEGGDYGWGTIFSIPTSGGTPNTLFSFDNTNGSYPLGSLTLLGSTLYGMTEWGGAHNEGEIFSIPTSGGTPTILYSFDGNIGADPGGSLTFSPGAAALFGMAGGGIDGDGTIFCLHSQDSSPSSPMYFLCTLTTSASPAWAGTVTGTPSQATYNSGTVLAITATARLGYVFSSWQLTDVYNNDLIGTNVANPTSPSTSLTIPAFSATLTAVFTRPRGTVWTWGDNAYVELGDNGNEFFSEKPVQVLDASDNGVLKDIVSVAAGLYQTVALKADGTVWTFGWNTNGQLGDNTTNGSGLPIQVLGAGGSGVLTDIVAVAAGAYHTVALKSDGTVWDWLTPPIICSRAAAWR
jgi:uncharacterized repeat protein (TIGR03803 family)